LYSIASCPLAMPKRNMREMSERTTSEDRGASRSWVILLRIPVNVISESGKVITES